jgi:hypothetical protein
MKRSKNKAMEKEKITNIVFDGVDHGDCPDYTDVFITSAEIGGRKLTDKELDEVNEDIEFVQKAFFDSQH